LLNLSQTYVEPNTAAQKPSRSLPRWLKIGFTVGLLALLAWQVRWADLAEALRNAHFEGFLAAAFLWIPNQWLQYMRWSLIARRSSRDVPRTDIRASYWLGHTLGFVTPGRIGAYGRGLFLKTVPVREATALTVLERLYSALSVNGIGLIALGLLPLLGWHASWADWGATISGALIMAGSSLLGLGMMPGLLTRRLLPWLRRQNRGVRLAESLESIANVSAPSSLLYLLLAITSLAVSLVQFILLLNALGVTVPLLAGMLAVQLNFFLKGNLPLTLGSLGVGEWTALICLRGLGVPDAQAVAASLILFAVNVAVPALIGMRYYQRVLTVHHDWGKRG